MRARPRTGGPQGAGAGAGARAPAFALVALLAAAMAAAPAEAATSLGTFDAHTVRLPEGGLVRGGLLALKSDLGAPGALPTFFARGNMTLETDELASGFAVGGVHPGVAPEYRRTREELGQAQAALMDEVAAGRGTFDLFVRGGLGPATLSSIRVPDVSVAAPSVETLRHDPWVSGAPPRPEMEVPLQGSHALEAQGDLLLEASGDFVLSLYNLDLTLADGRGVRQVRTGEVPGDDAVQSPVPGAGPTYAGSSVQREAFLHVRGGTLSLRVPASALAALYVAVDDAATPGQVEVGAPVGTVLPGPAGVDFAAPRDGLLPIHVSALDQAELDRYLSDEAGPAAPATAAPLPASLRWGGLALLAGALAVLAAAAALARRRAVARMQLLFGAGRYAEAERAAARLLAVEALAPADAALVRAVSLLRLDRAAEADALLGGRAARRVDGATREFLWACVRALQRRPAEAVRHLALCLAADPGYRAEALANPWLRPLVARVPAPDDSRRGRAAA